MVSCTRSLVLKTTILVLTFNYCRATLQKGEVTLSSSTNVSIEPLPLLYRQFKIKNFAARLVERKISISWNIEPYKPSGNKVAKDNPERTLEIFGNGNRISNVSINMTYFCKNESNNGSVNVTCQYIYSEVYCANYKFILGSPNNLAFVNVSGVIKNTTTFEMTENEEHPVKLTWKTTCETNNYTNSVPVSFNKNGTTFNLALDAICNSKQQSCNAYLKRNDAIPCIPPVIKIHDETVSFNDTTHSVSNLSIVQSNSDRFHIDIDWTDMICPPTPSTYKLAIIENGKNQIVENILVRNWCLVELRNGNSILRRKVTFNENQITSCGARTETLSFRTMLRPCFNYSVYVFRSENENPTLGAERYKNSFVIRKLEQQDILNLRVANVSSDSIELQWEIPPDCQKVENFLIPIAKYSNPIQNISLLSNITKCNESTCTVSWKYDQNLTPCTEYLIKVGRSPIHVTTLPPGVFIINANASRANNSSSFDIEWKVPRQCRPVLTTRREENRHTNPFFISSELATLLTDPCDNVTCHMQWRYKEKIEPCTTYDVNLGSLPQQFTTYPDFSGGIVTNLTIRFDVPKSLDEPATPVIRWDHPHCRKLNILEWQILVRKSQSNTTIVKPISSLEYSYKFVDAKACETYSFAIRTIFENSSDYYSTPEEHFKVDCPLKLLVPISAIAGLFLIAIIIASFLSRKRKRKEALIKESETNDNKLSSVESRDRIPSINRNRISCASRNSRNSRNSSNENAEMDLDCLPQMTKRPMNVRDICSFDVGQARKEFFLINKLTEIEAKRFPRTIAERPENKFKNRFLNTHPYDFNRVILSLSEEGQEDGYINASFIPGFAEKEKEYIAAQGPKDNTLGDFWQMILEQDVRLIAMVTSLYECGKKKCEKYWPDKDEFVVFSDIIQLELLKETTYSFYIKRKILVSKAPDFKREIQQFHFTAWPDFETPEQPEELIRFIEIVRRKARQWNLSSPIVVHCSAGVGRTGTFIALDYLIQQVLITDLIDVPKTVRHLRRYRLSMVQSEAQYVFLYSCIAHYVKTRLSQTEEFNTNHYENI